MRISNYDSGEPFFGRSASGRFDDYRSPASKRFGTNKRSGIDSSLTTVDDYALPQRWAAALHQHPQQPDGILYMSRHVNTDKAVVIFDRAKHRLHARAYKPLLAEPFTRYLAARLEESARR